MDGDDSLSDLLCSEDDSFLVEKEESVNEDIEDNSSLVDKEELVYEDYIAAYDEESVQMFFDKEMSFGFTKNASSSLSDFLKHARLEAITLILQTRAILGLHFQTAYVSVMYFDRLISILSIDSSDKSREMQILMQLVSMTCLLLAAKMEEIKVPTISDFQTEDFGRTDIRGMEVLILNTLEWNMSSITPFDFLHFFTTKLCKKSSQQHDMSGNARLILAVMGEINLMEYRPSVIAAAATLRTLDQNLTRQALESKMNSISGCPVLELEDVFTCYGIMQKLDVTKLPTSVMSPDLSPAYLSAMLDDYSSSAAVYVKRKGLVFIKSDDDSHDRPNKRRHLRF